MVVERNYVWLRATVYGICKHLAKQVITVVLLAKTILLFCITQHFRVEQSDKNVQEIVKFFSAIFVHFYNCQR